MTTEIEFSVPQGMADLGEWQIVMAKQIEANEGVPISEITRRVENGTTFIVSVETTLPSQTVRNMLSDIQDHLPPNATHVETREL